MNPIRKTLAQADITLFLIGGLLIGGGAGAFIGMSSSHTLETNTAIALLVAYEGLVLTSLFLVLRTLVKLRAARLARLRAQGILPDAALQSDADVIRLANNGLREEAALIYQEIHGGKLDVARFVVGLDKLRKTMIPMLLIVTVILIVAVFLSTSEEDKTGSMFAIIIFAAIFSADMVIFAARAKRLRVNREKLANGILPTPDSVCLWRKPGTTGTKFFKRTK